MNDNSQFRQLREQLNQVLIGQQAAIDHVLMAMLTGGHVLLEGVPGLGKTLLVRALARSMDGRQARIQFTPDLMPSDVSGHSLYDMSTQQFRIRRGPVFTNLLLADEINRAPAKTQAALLEVMQEGQVTIDGKALAVPKPFMVLATQNPIEQEGTYPLPEAELDRFLFKILLATPGLEDEVAIVRGVTAPGTSDRDYLEQVSVVASLEDWMRWREAVSALPVDERVMDYAVRLVQASRSFPSLQRGAGPRASINLIRTARARAWLASRDFVLPDDVKALFLPVLRHRVLLSPEAELEGHTPDQILLKVLETVPSPRMDT